VTRPLEERLREYATSMRALPPQLEELLALTSDRPIVIPGQTPLKDAIRLYGLFADDLEKILAGEELKPFLVEGTI